MCLLKLFIEIDSNEMVFSLQKNYSYKNSSDNKMIEKYFTLIFILIQKQMQCNVNAIEEQFLFKWFYKEPFTSAETFSFTKGSL